MQEINHWRFDSYAKSMGVFLGLLALVFVPLGAKASGSVWTFNTETVDGSAHFTSIKVDTQGNVHVAYVTDGDRVKYAFRDVNTSKWFNTEVDNRASFASIALDQDNNPHLCYTQRTMRYAYWDGKVWHKDEISPGAGAIAYYCGVAVSSDGVPHVTWYQERTSEDTNYLHMRHADLQNGEWLAKTIDWDSQTGKWNSLVLDKSGNPHISFDSFVAGQLKYASWDGKAWVDVPVDSRTSSQQPGRGMGNCLLLDSNGRAMISYFEDEYLKYARQKEDGTWSVETLAPVIKSTTWAGYRSSQALDSKGFPHIVYESAGVLRHIYWDGTAWQSQLIAGAGPHRLRYGAIAIGPGDIIYISYSDPDDGSLKVAVALPSSSSTLKSESAKKTVQ